MSPNTTPSHPPEPATHTSIRLAVGDVTIDGQLWDNPAARELAGRLPLTLTFDEYNAVEKVARLEPALSMTGMPAGDDPDPGEIGWYAPASALVLYYGDVGYWTGIARLGSFEASGVELLASSHDVTVTIAVLGD